MGRTGIRGKGVLQRWGPNHEIKAVITRWRRTSPGEEDVTAPVMYVEGRRMLEFLAVQRDDLSLPGVRLTICTKCEMVKYMILLRP